MIRTLLSAFQVATAALLVFVLTGCFELRERLKINADESGTYSLAIIMDMSGMLDLAGPPGSEERKAAVEKMGEDQGEIAKSTEGLPKGITFENGGTRVEGEKLFVEATFGFSELEALQQPMEVFDHLKTGENGPLAKADDGEPKPLLRVPIERKGKKLMLHGKVYGDPPEDLPQTPPEGEEVPPQMAAMVEALKAIQFVFEVETVKHKVKKHDADEVDGKVLRWTHSLDDLQQGATIDLTLQR